MIETRDAGPIRWGIIGPGGIASRFADAMTRVHDGEIVAVSSRSRERADAFGDRFAVRSRYDDDGALATDPDVDAVYVATPHARHEADAIRCLEAGKHVLCEKPFALNAVQAERMVAAARVNDRFLMEAIWSRFLPAYVALREVLADGRIGTPVHVDADFGFPVPFDPTHRLLDAHQGGGALLDLGIYPLQLCRAVLGPIQRVAAGGSIGATEVDEQVAAVLEHAGGGIGVVKASITAPLGCTARICGTEGWIELPAFMHCPTSFTIGIHGAAPEQVEHPWEGDGLEHEIREVHRCLAQGVNESPTMPLSETLELAAVMDDIRSQIGLRYPGE